LVSIKDWLLDDKRLFEWRIHTLDQRCEEIKRLKNIDVTRPTLAKFYRINRVSFRVGTYRYWDTRTPQETFNARMRFVIRLIRTLDSGKEVIFVDETTFNKWNW
jgi:hypothetical protein